MSSGVCDLGILLSQILHILFRHPNRLLQRPTGTFKTSASCIGRNFERSITLANSSGDNVCLSASTPRSSKSAKPHFSADAIDADKEGYVDYLNQLLPLVRPGGLILAHNVDMAPDYVMAVARNADLDTVFYTQGAGMGVTLKKR